MEICSHLEWLIKRNSNISRMDDACDKWTMDRKHIINYNREKMRTVEVNKVVERRYIKK